MKKTEKHNYIMQLDTEIAQILASWLQELSVNQLINLTDCLISISDKERLSRDELIGSVLAAAQQRVQDKGEA
jgi:hypothetical protein